jgi:hypothetical protein
MKETPTRSISTLLQPNHRDLQTVLSKVKAIQTLNQLIIPLLDPSLQKYCQVANLSNGILVLLTANGSVATQIRYATPDLLKKLHGTHALKHIREIQSIVRPPLPPAGVERGPAKSKLKPAAPLSPETAAILLTMAETIEDPKLRDIMLSIAGNVTK